MSSSASAPPPQVGQTTAYPPQYPSFPPPPPSADVGKPTAGAVLAIIGGVFILLGGLAELALGAYLSSISFGIGAGVLRLFGALGALLGILVLVFGVLVYSNPANHVVYGVLIIVFSIVSLTSFAGGFFIGFLLALIGGILTLVWKPTPPQVYYVGAPPVQRMCPKCGRAVDPTVQFCPYCGNALG